MKWILTKRFSFQFRKRKRLKNSVRYVDDNYSCYVSKSNMIQCKHMMIANKILNLILIGKCKYQSHTISQWCNIGSHTSPRLYISFTELKDDGVFPFANIEHNSDNHESNNNQKYFDEINITVIETNQFCNDNVEYTENNTSNEFVTRSSYMVICNKLFNSMKNDNQIYIDHIHIISDRNTFIKGPFVSKTWP